MELKIFKDYSELSIAAAMQVINCVKSKPNAVLCFATGDTPKLAYQKIGEVAKQDNVDFTKCFFIGLDEWLGIPPANTGSCNYFLHHYLFAPLGINSSQVHLFDAMTMNEEVECEKMNKLVDEKTGIDLMLAGVGINGHIGFNEPGADIGSGAHIAQLEEITKSVGQKYFTEEVVINKGMTLGLKQVMNARTLIMMANGNKKAPVVRRVLNEDISTDFPASLIRQHNNALLMIDEEAASELGKQAV
jgi:glucosamine-6-phosphate isomerase